MHAETIYAHAERIYAPVGLPGVRNVGPGSLPRGVRPQFRVLRWQIECAVGVKRDVV
jgi:hypothetical protein